MSLSYDCFSGLMLFRSTYRNNWSSFMWGMWANQLRQGSLMSSRILADAVRASSVALRSMNLESISEAVLFSLRSA